jgi:hypothetical protein
MDRRLEHYVLDETAKALTERIECHVAAGAKLTRVWSEPLKLDSEAGSYCQMLWIGRS